MVSSLGCIKPVDNQPTAASRFLKESACFSVVPENKQEAFERIACCWIAALKGRQRTSLYEADRDYILKEVRVFLTGLPENCFKSRPIALLAKELLAAKLCVRAELLDKNPGFEEFARQNHLHRYLLTYCQQADPSFANSHPWEVDPEEIKILSNGIVKPWNEASKDLQSVPARVGHPKMSWHYGLQGIQNKDMYDWNELTPFLKKNPAEWGNQYLFEICVCTSSQPNFVGDHTWMRLKTPEGDVYSVGLYRPAKTRSKESYDNPLRLKPAYLMSPDYSEFCSCEIYTLGVAVTFDQFSKIKNDIENDKKECLEFHSLVRNCTAYTLKHARTAGLTLPAQASALQVLLRRSESTRFIPVGVQTKIKSVLQRMPSSAQLGCKFIPSLFLNGVQVALGSGKVDNRLLRRPDGQQSIPHMNSFLDFFKPSKLDMYHPHILYKEGFRQVTEWREKKTLHFQARKEALSRALSEMEKAGVLAAHTIWIRTEISRLDAKLKQIRYRFPKTCRAKL